MLNLITFNRWWDTGKVDEVYLKPYRRFLFYKLIKFLDTRQALLIYGLRRIGKTTILYQLIDALLKKGVDKKHILYFSFDERVLSLEELFKNYSELVLSKDLLKEKRIYVFLDEIQKLKDWQEQLKIFYDLYPNLKFIVSGSASLVIFKAAKESLAGRVYEFILPILSFSEYLEFLKEEFPLIKDIFDLSSLKDIYLKKDRLLPLFFSYLKKGGFIEIAMEDDDLKLKEYSKSILEKVIFTDIALSFKIREPQILKAILELVASTPGLLLDYSKLAQTFKKDQRVISNYVYYLKYALLIRILYNFSGSKFASERKLKKTYLSSTNFIYSLCFDRFFYPEFLGKVVENLAVSLFEEGYFWKERQNEVDLVLKDKIPLEIKFKEKIHKEDIKSLLKFSQKFNIKKAFVLTKDELKQEKVKHLSIYFIPVWIYLLSYNKYRD